MRQAQPLHAAAPQLVPPQRRQLVALGAWRAAARRERVPQRRRVCSAMQQRAQQLANASGFKSAPMLYLHAQKTGGSTLECATEGNPTLAPRWVNMGHTSREKVDNCIERCTFGEGEIVPKVVVMVRDPYSFCAPRVIPQATPWA